MNRLKLVVLKSFLLFSIISFVKGSVSPEEIIRKYNMNSSSVESLFTEMMQKKKESKTEEEVKSVKLNLKNLLQVSRALSDMSRIPSQKEPIDQQIARIEEDCKLDCLNAKIAAALSDRTEEEIYQIEIEYDEKKERKKKDAMDNYQLIHGMQKTIEMAKKSREEGEKVVGFFAKLLPMLGNGSAPSSATTEQHEGDIPIQYLTAPNASGASSTSPRQPQSTDQQPSSSWWFS